MRLKLLSDAMKYLSQSRSRKIWARVVGVFAAVVVFCTTYALILPALTLETEVYCGKEEHIHTDECYESSNSTQKSITCSLESLGIHTHSSSCYDSQGNITCGYADYVVHVHDADCYDAAGNLICPLSEIAAHVHSDSCYKVTVHGGHTHSDACYSTEQGELTCTLTESAGHTHSDACYQETQTLVCTDDSAEHTHSDTCYEKTKTLICTTAESSGHTHSSGCYAQNKVLTCGQEESAGTEERTLTCTKTEVEVHTHSSGCYTNGVLTCGKMEIHQHTHTDTCFETVDDAAAESDAEKEPICGKEEHEHDENCYSDATADIETAEDWERTFENIELTGVYADDLLEIAKSQLGYAESTKNYIINEEDSRKKGYSRYGDWYGDKYGDWCAMYVSFCLSYSEVVGVPYESNCQDWIDILSDEKYDLYAEASEYTPKVGDIIFFDWQGDGVSDHVGIVAEVTEATETEPAKVKTIEGNSSDRVEYNTYNMNSAYIVGYAMLPEHETGYDCGYVEHTHDEYCYNGGSRLLCQVKEHTHDDTCLALEPLTEEEQAEVDAVIAAIDALPSVDEVEETLAVLEEADDMEGYEAYFMEIAEQCQEIYFDYQLLNENQQLHVTNIQKLWDLEWLWSAVTLIDEITSDTPTTVASASTSEFIELNLYDYGSNINTLYNSNNKYPGFQWNGGAYLKSTYDRHVIDYIDFGNSMITDFTYGTYSSSNAKSANSQMIGKSDGSNGAINKLDVSSYGVTNRPIGMSLNSSITDTSADVLSRTLGSDGYPALTDGTSLSYLFVNGTYATKKNSASIDGLFQQNATSGEYYYNSRWNHAQYSNNKFTLYNQIITPNFITYPFGNFLPFNSITDGSNATQVSKIISFSDYVQEVINDLYYASDYSTNGTKHQLVDMLAMYRSDLKTVTTSGGTAWQTWSAKDAINDYFQTSDSAADNPSNDTSLITDALLEKMYNIDWDVKTNFFFGMEMKMNFIQPKGGMTGKDTNGDGASDYPMKFYFTGDDDVWVYIDDVLFLDLSGIHRHVGGEIDFVNGKVYYYYLDTANTGDVSTTPYKTYTFAEILSAAGKSTDDLNAKGTFKDYTSHKFNFYYTERGSGSSVCRLNFNFPLLRRNTISVAKELSIDEGAISETLGNPDFKFQILKADDSGNKTEELFIGANVSYTIYDADDNKIGTGTTDANGVFTLKAGQRAEFADIKESSGKYYVRELLDSDIVEQYGSITVDGSTTTTNYNVTIGSDTFTGLESPVKDASDGATRFDFNNQITKAKLGELEISKNLEAYPQTRDTKQFDMYVTLDGTPLPVGTNYTVGDETRTVEKAGYITIAAGETAVIENIISGTKFVVKEDSASSEGYTVTYTLTYPGLEPQVSSGDSVSGVIKTAASVELIVTNAEKGTTVKIPVTKTIVNPDDNSHRYTFMIEQVKDSSGTTLDEGGTKYESSLPVDVTDSTEFEFIINYKDVDITSYPAMFYYKITEAGDVTYTKTDASVYIAEVTVMKDSDGELSAELSNLWTLVDGEPVTVESKVITFENTLTGDLSIKKILSGATDETKTLKFDFDIELKQGDIGLSGDFEAEITDADGNVSETKITFEDGYAQISLGHNEVLVIKNVPYGVSWTITEPSNGYQVFYQINGGTVENNTSANGSIQMGLSSVVFTNATAYELPETGGFGTQIYILAGLMLAGITLYLLYKNKNSRKEVS